VAGPLNPPAGSVSSTFKTLGEVEPRIAVNATNTPGDNDGTPSLLKISQPGSYYLTGNITGVAGKHGIEIASGGVTLDLNGFTVQSVAGSGTLDGISSQTSESVRIMNGSVKGWGGTGINLFASTNAVVTDVRVLDNGAYGIRGSNRTIIRNCVASGNASAGLRTISGGVIEGCSAVMNGTNGIEVLSECLVRGNQCFSNGNVGDGAGIRVFSNNNRVEGNSCIGADRGVEVTAAGNLIIRNSRSGNTVNWVIAAGNAYGAIIATPAGAAVNGNSASSALGTTDANANFSY
jgi:hypothetical protein